MSCVLLHKPARPVAFIVSIHIIPSKKAFSSFPRLLPKRSVVRLFREVISAEQESEAIQEALSLFFAGYRPLKGLPPTTKNLPDYMYVDPVPLYAHELERTLSGFVRISKERYDETRALLKKISEMS
ncbi:MAG: hypothetical protein HYV45_02990 [Candidatus Moranbacteria bacterium]|nr:hypothetical protein [Candidatus Moranbacteria bacterium]